MQHESSLNFAQAVIADAMRERRMVSAIYNSGELRLAPHQVVLRNGAFYLGAFNPAKSRRVDEEPSLGHYKLEGLSGLTLLDEVFEPLADSALGPARPDDVVIASID